LPEKNSYLPITKAYLWNESKDNLFALQFFFDKLLKTDDKLLFLNM